MEAIPTRTVTLVKQQRYGYHLTEELVTAGIAARLFKAAHSRH